MVRLEKGKAGVSRPPLSFLVVLSFSSFFFPLGVRVGLPSWRPLLTPPLPLFLPPLGFSFSLSFSTRKLYPNLHPSVGLSCFPASSFAILALAPPSAQNRCHLGSHILKSYGQVRTILFDCCRAQADVAASGWACQCLERARKAEARTATAQAKTTPQRLRLFSSVAKLGITK